MTKVFVKGECSATVVNGEGDVERFLVKQGFSLLTELTEEEVAELAEPKRKRRATSKSKSKK